MVSGTRIAVVGLEGRRLLIRGVTLTLVGLAVQQSGLVLHRNLNHNDIYCLVQLGGLYFFYRGASQLKDPPSRSLTDSEREACSGCLDPYSTCFKPRFVRIQSGFFP